MFQQLFSPIFKSLFPATLEAPSSNIIVNGTFDDNSAWTLDDPFYAWSISDGKARYAGGFSFRAISQVPPLKIGHTYEITFTCEVPNGAGAVFCVAGYLAEGIWRRASGTYTERLVADGTEFLILAASNDFIGTVDDISVIEIL